MAETALDMLAIPKVLAVRVVRASQGLAVVPAGSTRRSVFPTLEERNKAAVHEFIARERGRG